MPRTRKAITGSRFPLTVSGSISSSSTPERRAARSIPGTTISPGPAAAWSRAATFATSPITIRSTVASPPTTISPVLTPARDLDLHAPSLRQLRVELRHGAPHRLCRLDRAYRVVLTDQRDPEHREDRIADELLHRAAEPSATAAIRS